MGYIERILQNGETVACRGGLHWVIMMPGIVLNVASLALGFVAFTLHSDVARYGLLALSTLVFVIGGYQVLRGWIERMNTEIVVTNHRVIVKTGLVSQNSVEISLNRIESVVIKQSLLGRMLDYGSLVIRGVGAGLEPIEKLASPLEFRRHITLGG